MRSQRGRKPSAPDKRDYVLFTALVQIFLCAAVFLLLLLLSRGDSTRAQGLRQDFALMLSRELQVQDVTQAVAAVRDFFLPQAGTVAVMGQPDGETTSAPAKEERQPSQAYAAEKEAETEAPPEDSTKPSPEPAAPTQPNASDETTKSLAIGGNDQTEKAEKASVSYSPSAVTVPITRPVEGGRYSSYYGYRNNPITHQYAFHTGLDIAVAYGTKIRAAYGGTVRQVGEDSRSGKYVTITHDDGYETFYCHCSDILVSRGTVVRAGEAVACVGSTGWSTGPHLHFEIRKNGAKIDPLSVLEHDV